MYMSVSQSTKMCVKLNEWEVGNAKGEKISQTKYQLNLNSKFKKNFCRKLKPIKCLNVMEKALVQGSKKEKKIGTSVLFRWVCQAGDGFPERAFYIVATKYLL